MSDRKKQLLLAFALPFVLCIGLLIGNRVFPFGDRCILHVDMYHQYMPFFTEMLNKIREGGSFMYSWNIGLGSDFVSVYVYYLSSPLNWLLILCPSGYVIEFMTILIVVKISACGAGCFYYLREHFKLSDKKEIIPAYVFALAYAFSGFVAAYSWDIMWMDSIALAPLIILGLEKLVKENKVGLYYITLALSIVSNYYISMMICMFLVFYFVVLFFETKSGKLMAVVRFTIYSLLAGGTGVVLMLPEMKILSYSGSSGMSFPEKLEWYFNLIAELSRMCTTAEPHTGNYHWPNLYSGAFAILLVVLYFFAKDIPWKKKLPRIAMLAFFIVSFSNNYLDFIWHGLHFPDSLPGRQAFLFTFMMVVMAYETYRHRESIRLVYIGISVAAIVGLLIASYVLMDETITEPVCYWITGLFVACYASLLVLHRLVRPSDKRTVLIMLYSIMIIELTINMACTGFSTTSRTAYLEDSDGYEALLEMAEEDSGEGSFYRVENTERLTKNDDAKYGFKSGTQFSSLMNINVSHFYQKLYMEGGKNYYCFNGATPITAAMLSVKYMILDDPMAENNIMELVGESNGLYLYRYKYTLPIGYVMSEEAVESFEASTFNKVYGINNLGYFLGATEETLKEADYRMESDFGTTTITFHENGHFYANYKECGADSLTFEFENGNSWKYGKTTHKYLFDLGYRAAGETITITNSKSEALEFEAYKLNIDAVETAYYTLAQQTMYDIEYTDTTVKGKIDITNPGRLVMSIPSEEGWTLYVDGEKRTITDFAETFISVSLLEGTHDIELRYETPGLKAGALFSGGCVIVFVILILLRKMMRKRYEKVN